MARAGVDLSFPIFSFFSFTSIYLFSVIFQWPTAIVTLGFCFRVAAVIALRDVSATTVCLGATDTNKTSSTFPRFFQSQGKLAKYGKSFTTLY